MLNYKYYINKLDRKIFVMPEFRDGGPGAYAFGHFQYDPQKNDGKTEYDDYKADLKADLEIAMKTIPDEDFTEYSLTIQPWDGEKIFTPAANPVVKDPIEPNIPVPVSGEIRAKAYAGEATPNARASQVDSVVDESDEEE